MSGIGWPGTSPLPPALAPPSPALHSPEPRSVEPAAETSTDSEGATLSFNTTRAVLLLVQRSAETFRDVAALLGDIGAAAAISGAAVAPAANVAQGVDEYA